MYNVGRLQITFEAAIKTYVYILLCLKGTNEFCQVHCKTYLKSQTIPGRNANLRVQSS